MRNRKNIFWLGRLNNVFIIFASLFFLFFAVFGHKAALYSLAEFGSENGRVQFTLYYLFASIGPILVIFAPLVLLLIFGYIANIEIYPKPSVAKKEDHFANLMSIETWIEKPVGFASFLLLIATPILIWNFSERGLSNIENFQQILFFCEFGLYGKYLLLCYAPISWCLGRAFSNS